MIDRAYLVKLVMDVNGFADNEQRRFNHEGCSAGADLRERLYVKHRGAQVYVAYCHNCGQAGYVRIGVKLRERDDLFADLAHMFSPQDGLVPIETIVSADYHLPTDSSSDTWDTWAVDWLWRCSTDRDEVIKSPYSWSYSASLKRIIMPARRLSDAGFELSTPSSSALYQARAEKGVEPKCLTIINSEVGHKVPIIYHGGQGMPIFIVEDPMSAHRIHFDTHATALALLGTHANDQTIAQILLYADLMPHRPVIIWLDDDMAGIKGEVALTRTLHPLMPRGGKLSNLHMMREAKSMTRQELRQLVHDLTRDRS